METLKKLLTRPITWLLLLVSGVMALVLGRRRKAPIIKIDHKAIEAASARLAKPDPPLPPKVKPGQLPSREMAERLLRDIEDL